MHQTLQSKNLVAGLLSPGGLVLLLLLSWLLLGWNSTAQAGNVPQASNNGSEGADYWRQVTQGATGYSANSSAEAGVLINRSGETWRQLRNNQIQPYGKWALLVTVGVLVGVYLLTGGSKLEQPRSGRTIERWRKFDRYLHWLVAGLFIILALSGLSLLYGRFFLPDLVGRAAFSSYLQLAKSAHNYLGVVFVLSLALMLLRLLKKNIPNMTDIRWFLQGGGMIKGKHPHSGYINGGEKAWFWVLLSAGALLSVSGLVLDFPGYLVELRSDFQTSNIVHAIASLVLICGALGHIYMGTLGTEGALEGMVGGQVDEVWAKQHHDLWYEELKRKP